MNITSKRVYNTWVDVYSDLGLSVDVNYIISNGGSAGILVADTPRGSESDMSNTTELNANNPQTEIKASTALYVKAAPPYTSAIVSCVPAIINGGGTGGQTNLSTQYSTSAIVINNDNGSGVVLTESSDTQAGVMSSVDKIKLDGIEEGATRNIIAAGTNVTVDTVGDTSTVNADDVDLSNTPAASTVDVESSTGTATTIAAATDTLAGVMSSTDKSKLDGIEAGAEVNPTIVANLNSTSDTEVLAASQGKILNDKIDNIPAGLYPQGDWNADTNTPDITGTTDVGNFWVVSVAGNTNLNGITSWDVGDLAIYTATGFIKYSGTTLGVTSVNGLSGVVTLTPELSATQNPTNIQITPTLEGESGSAIDLDLVDSTNAGLMSPTQNDKLDGIEANATATNLIAGNNISIDQTGNNYTINASDLESDLGSSLGATSFTITNTNGSGVIIPQADDTNAGVMSNADKIKLDGLEGTNLSVGNNPTIATITSSTGNTVELPVSASNGAGIITAAQYNKLDGIEANATATNLVAGTNITIDQSGDDFTINAADQAATNLNTSYAPAAVTVTNSNGTPANIQSATDSYAGVMSSTQSSMLDTAYAQRAIKVWEGSFNVGQGTTGISDPITSSNSIELSSAMDIEDVEYYSFYFTGIQSGTGYGRYSFKFDLAPIPQSLGGGGHTNQLNTFSHVQNSSSNGYMTCRITEGYDFTQIGANKEYKWVIDSRQVFNSNGFNTTSQLLTLVKVVAHPKV